MQTIQIDIKDSYLPNILEILNGLKDVMIENIYIENDLQDVKLFQEAKQDKTDMKSIDEMLKEYNIES
ncbi:MAG: hypothetical protein QM493_06335 [Sulfurovum sp.]